MNLRLTYRGTVIATLFVIAGLAAPVPGVFAAPPRTPVELRSAERPHAPSLDGIRCFDAEFGWIYCNDPAQAASIAADLREAALLFHRYFGELPARGAVVVMTNVGAGAMGELRRAGAAWVMPWVPDDLLANINIEDQVRKQVETQLRDRGFDDGMIEMAVEQAMAQLGGAGGDGQRGPRRRGVAGLMSQMRPLTHELGHFWFGNFVWGDGWLSGEARAEGPGVAGAHRYGSPSPDWLDEVGAILMETADLTARRHEQMRLMLAGDGTGIRPLAELFTMTHPAMDNRMLQRAVRDARAGAGAGAGEAGERPARGGATIRVIPITGAAGDDMAGLHDAGAFYAQCRSIADFMIERSEHPRLFAQIALDLKDDPSMETWLAANGAKFGLPTDVATLDREWREWAMKRHLGDL